MTCSPTRARPKARLRGQVRDKGANEAAVGATVVATSPALQGEQVVITDDTGQYFITALPPGVYTLTVYYNDVTYSRGNVLVQVGKEVVVNISVNTSDAAGKPKGEVITIHGCAPIIDQGSTKTGVTIGDDYTRNIPVGRTFGEVIGASAGAAGDEYGTGVLRRDVGREHVRRRGHQHDGLGVRRAVDELAERVRVRDRGHHRWLRGRVRPRHGRYHQRRDEAGLERVPRLGVRLLLAGRVDRRAKTVISANAVDTQANPGNNYDFGAEVGGPIIKDKLWFHVGFDPSMSNTNVKRVCRLRGRRQRRWRGRHRQGRQRRSSRTSRRRTSRRS